ncbi:sulfate ABC transporter permease subunit CysW [Saccharibacillus sp. CPCC 101409]|uniref:sulfate ABC transporter permease subunit CysW n=1 Tax=Saccharibacillus sp. CPCC 101409 TaxID=3058041 RepID=UPI002670F8A9|nr:sulfate ABC transporter permease subunit CysW [Saccharibacillus sp. CPCC 101409]MDO3412690.1 sulfate ABC transporter permease subunit CysW [Saccharibacillus sp. CPCC 101409]
MSDPNPIPPNPASIPQPAAAARNTARAQGRTARLVLIALGVLFILVMLVLPLITVCVYALKQGWDVFSNAITDPYAIKALQLTLLATAAAVICNTVFGLFASWTISKFHFRGKQFLTTLIDIPFAISPVIAGLVFILVFGRIGWAYDFLQAHDLKVVFAVPGVILATIFVTFPFVARELIPLMQAQGSDEEEAAALMGAGWWTIYRKITLPHIKWGLLYGIILCTARALGEFGAVSVVSGHLRGKTNTLPLHIEILFSEFQLTAAFAVSSILVAAAIIILILRNIVEFKGRKEEHEHVR